MEEVIFISTGHIKLVDFEILNRTPDSDDMIAASALRTDSGPPDALIPSIQLSPDCHGTSHEPDELLLNFGTMV